MTGKTRRTMKGGTGVRGRKLWGGIMAALTAASVSACGGGGESTCAFWADKLARSGDIEKALQNLGSLKCTEAGPVLKQLFDDGLLRSAALDLLIKIDDPATAVPIVRSALLVDTTARQAAGMVRDWKMGEARPELEKLLADEAFMESRDVAFDALMSLGDPPPSEDLLIQLALSDPNKQPVEINQRAIAELSRQGSKKAVPAIVKALFVRSLKGADAYAAARLALAKLGDASVVDALVALMQGKNPELAAFAQKHGFEPWEITGTPKVVQILSDALDPRASEALVEDIAAEIVPPDVDDQTFARWANDKGNRYLINTFALAYMGPESVVGGLGAIFRDPKKDVMRQRLSAARTLAMIGSEAAQDVLIRAWSEELIVEVLKAGTLEIVATAIDDRRLAEWDRMLGILGPNEPKPRKPIELSTHVKEVLEENERVRAHIQVVRECGDKVGCYIEKTKSENQHEQVKALAVLGRGRFGVTPEIKAALMEAFDKADKPMVDTKRYALIGLARLGNQADGDALIARGEALLEQGDAFWGGELYSVGHGLKRRMLR